jgi:hypothetical protein
MSISSDAFEAWLGRYIAAWRSQDPAAIGDLLSGATP